MKFGIILIAVIGIVAARHGRKRKHRVGVLEDAATNTTATNTTSALDTKTTNTTLITNSKCGLNCATINLNIGIEADCKYMCEQYCKCKFSAVTNNGWDKTSSCTCKES
jgi:hypothetical protein